LVAIPLANRAAAAKLLKKSTLPDVVSKDLVALKGAIRLDLRRVRVDGENPAPPSGISGYECDALCLGILFTPGVSSVTINSSENLGPKDHQSGSGALDYRAMTYRLIPKAECRDRAVRPTLDYPRGTASKAWLDNGQLRAQWNLKLAREVCLTREAPIARQDMLMREGEYDGDPRHHSNWSTRVEGPWVRYVEIRDAHHAVLFRRFRADLSVLSVPLLPGPAGSTASFHFEWMRSRYSNKPGDQEPSLLDDLEAHTNVVTKPDRVGLISAMRDELETALDDPSMTAEAPAFQLVPAYFEALPNPLSAKDLNIVTRLARDDRVERYSRLEKLAKLPPEQTSPIRDAFVKRALATDQPNRLQLSGANIFIAGLPTGTYAVMTADEKRLLADPKRNWILFALAKRLADGGMSNAAQLVGILREQSAILADRISDPGYFQGELGIENRSRFYLVQAAGDALCKLGPATRALRPQFEPLVPLLYANDDRAGYSSGFADWDILLVRMGKPIEELKAPVGSSQTDERHREWVRSVMKHDPERCY
jgi:hypothetical protein